MKVLHDQNDFKSTALKGLSLFAVAYRQTDSLDSLDHFRATITRLKTKSAKAVWSVKRPL